MNTPRRSMYRRSKPVKSTRKHARKSKSPKRRSACCQYYGIGEKSTSSSGSSTMVSEKCRNLTDIEKKQNPGKTQVCLKTGSTTLTYK